MRTRLEWGRATCIAFALLPLTAAALAGCGSRSAASAQSGPATAAGGQSVEAQRQAFTSAPNYNSLGPAQKKIVDQYMHHGGSPPPAPAKP